MNSGSYIFGIVFGLGMVLIALLVLRNTKNDKGGMRGEFDERQLAARATAYKWGFFSLMAANITGGTVGAFRPWAQPLVGECICVFFALTVFAAVCIIKDAFTPLRKNRLRVVAIFLLLIISNTLSAVTRLSNNPLFENGMLTIHSINLSAAIMLIVTLVIWGVAYLVKKGREEDEESQA